MNQEIKNKKEWQLSLDLAVSIHKLMADRPSEEYEDEFSLSNEIRNTAISIPCTIVSGYRVGGELLLENLSLACGLLARLETQLRIAANVELLEEEKVTPLLVEIENVRVVINL